jgi:formylglycine-generating enzyme required for sulfatase activity
MASSALNRAESSYGISPNIRIEAVLIEAGRVPEGMVFVPGGAYQLVGSGAPTNAEVRLDDFFIDKYEVSNAQYRAFILDGGYSNEAYWIHPFTREGRALSWDEAMAHFRDRTGLPGPRSWVNQNYPAGRGEHPVTDITWYEAAAFAEYVGKQLPTIFQWEKAARDGGFTHFEEYVLPWGLAQSVQNNVYRANFGGSGPASVGGYAFGVSPFGAYNMAGNAKEWCLNAMADGYITTGGSWEDPSYMFSAYGVFPGFYSSPSLGFRCARQAPGGTGGQGAMPIPIGQRTPSYERVDEATFEAYLSHYRYDRHPLQAELVERTETADWTREKVRFEGVGGEHVLAYLYLPKRAAGPFQCIVYVPGGNVFFEQSLPEQVEWLMSPHVKAGRAVFTVVMKGMIEREWEPGHVPADPGSVQFREEMVLHATELSLGLDYLETRDDIDVDKLAYLGLSWGSGSRLVFAAVEDRYGAVILLGGGIDERMQPTLPEASNINFAPYIEPPKLLLNGTNDEEHPYYTRALPLYNLLREPKKLVLVDGGHVPPPEGRVPAVNEWLDETLGPVEFE